MARLLKSVEPLTHYKDRKFPGSDAEYLEALRCTTTLYIGNLAFHTTEEQIHELFGKCGAVKKIIMGLDKNTLTPCGFCFVEYYTRSDAETCVKYLNGTMLDEREIRVDFDWGFQEGRQYGRGKSGGQVRDEYRTDFDQGRGGYGKLVALAMDEMRHGDGDGGGSPRAEAAGGGRKRGRELDESTTPRAEGGSGGGGGKQPREGPDE